MTRLLPLVVAFLCAPLFAQVPSQVAPAAALKVTARAERANATYQVGDEPLGSFGIIGPTRMNYGKVISVLEYMRRSLSEVLSADQDDE